MRLRNTWLVTVALSLVLGLGLFASGVRADADCCPDRPNVQLNCQRNACSYGTCLSQCSTQKNGVSILIPYYDDVPGMEFIFGDATVEGLGAIISRALQIFFASIGLLFLVYLLYGGFTIASAMGAPEQVENGKKIITRAVIGLLIMFMSFWMVQLVELILGLEIFRSDGVDEPISTPGNTAEVVEGPAPLVAINEPPPGAKEWGYDADLVATLPFDERNLPEYAGARFCYQKTGEAYQYLRTPALAYGAAAEGAVLGAQLAQGTPLPPGWTVLNEPESTCIDVLFDETLSPPDGSDGVLYQQPADKLTVPVVFDKLSDYTWQVGTWVRGEDETLVPGDYSPTSTFETGVNATPPTPTLPVVPGKKSLQFNFMTYNFPSGDPAKLQQIADYIEANNLSVVMFQEFTDEDNAKETMLGILQNRDSDWQMISTKYDDSRLTDSYTIYAKWNLRALAEMNLNHERKAVTAIADTPVGPLRLFIVHTSAREGTRYVCDQLNAYISFINQAIADDIPYVIAGDFNAELNDLAGYPNCPTVKEWFRTRHQISCVDARMNSAGQCDFSFGSENQNIRDAHVIDYVLVPNDNPDIMINQAWVSKTRYLGGDEHYPVLANLTVKGTGQSVVAPTPTTVAQPTQSPGNLIAPTEDDVRIAFIGDVGMGANPESVLRRIMAEQVDLVVINGDFGYEGNSPWDFARMLENELDLNGRKMPVIGSLGNHDLSGSLMQDYQNVFSQRLQNVPGLVCTDVGNGRVDVGVFQTCTYKGIAFVLSGIGTVGEDAHHRGYITQQLSTLDPYLWKFCAWHKNHKEYQVGGKDTEVPMEFYSICANAGAIITTAHEHSYSRTKTISTMQNQTVNPSWPDPNTILISPGNSMVIVSGLGGRSYRDQRRCLPATYPYGCNQEWAFMYTSSQDQASFNGQPLFRADDAYGVAIMEFDASTPMQASGWFVTEGGRRVDQYSLTTQR